MKKIRISAAIATFNEEKNISDCILSVKKIADEVVVVDGSSDDRTADVAKSLGAKVISTTNKKMFHKNKNLAIKNTNGEWVFLIDADERVDDDLAKEIKEKLPRVVEENGFFINRKNWFLGGFLKKGGLYPDRDIRLFRQGKGRLGEINVHEKVTVEGKVGFLKGDLWHFADPAFERYLARSDRYTSLTADEFMDKKVSRGFLSFFYYAMLKPVFTCLNIYVKNKGYQDGFRGFVWAFFSGAHYFWAYAKYWERKN